MEAESEILGVLRANGGYEDPALWIDYARRHGFQRVAATRVPNCPDCGAAPRRALGQYVYYSNLLRLKDCGGCGLVWADARIDPATIRRHFEGAYKSPEYFERDRGAILRHLARLVDALTPEGGSVLDIGGATGHLMTLATRRRPDLKATVHDLSETAARHARETLGLDALCGDVGALERHDRRYDLVVLSDVLYYEPEIARLWSAIGRRVRPGGAVLIRVPNKTLAIRLSQAAFRLRAGERERKLQDRVRFFNPEHIYVFRRRYLARRLRAAGFGSVRFLPSPLVSGDTVSRRAAFSLAAALNRLSAGLLVLTPGMVAIGQNRR